MAKETTSNKALSLKSLTKSSVWDVQENDIFRMLDAAEKDVELKDNLRHYADIIRSAFMIEDVKDDSKPVLEKYAKQGYKFVTSSVSYQAGRYYTLSDASGNNLVTYSFQANVSSTLSLITATGMVKSSSYTVKYSTTAPSDATTAWHGLYIGSSATGITTAVSSFTAQ